MAKRTPAIMAQIEAIADLDTLHPRALLTVDVIVERHGAEAVAQALTWLYAEARFDLRVLRERMEAAQAAHAALGQALDRAAPPPGRAA